MSKPITSGGTSRFSDSPLAFGLERFESANKRDLWMFSIRRFCGGDILHEELADLKTLRSMQRWIEKAIVEVQTDGNRKETKNPEAGNE